MDLVEAFLVDVELVSEGYDEVAVRILLLQTLDVPCVLDVLLVFERDFSQYNGLTSGRRGDLLNVLQSLAIEPEHLGVLHVDLAHVCVRHLVQILTPLYSRSYICH